MLVDGDGRGGLASDEVRAGSIIMRLACRLCGPVEYRHDSNTALDLLSVSACSGMNGSSKIIGVFARAVVIKRVSMNGDGDSIC